jgi:UDPglucose 6-dehydrogenase
LNITVVGTGYVGLVAAACFAETGNRVIGADIDQRKIDALNSGEVPIYEPGLEELLHRNQQAGRLTFTTDVGQAIESAQVIFIAVGTPPDEDGSADLRHVLAVAEVVGQRISSCDRTTNPGGTTY